jgi:hypothetical protein
MNNATTQFEEGNIYEMRFVTDSDLRVKFCCTRRTPKMATFSAVDRTETIKRRIKVGYEGEEYVVDGKYSMAPTIRASRVVG